MPHVHARASGCFGLPALPACPAHLSALKSCPLGPFPIPFPSPSSADCCCEWFERERTCPMCRAAVGPANKKFKSKSDGSTPLFPTIF